MNHVIPMAARYAATYNRLMDMRYHELNREARRYGFIPEGYGKAREELVYDVADAIHHRHASLEA